MGACLMNERITILYNFDGLRETASAQGPVLIARLVGGLKVNDRSLPFAHGSSH